MVMFLVALAGCVNASDSEPTLAPVPSTSSGGRASTSTTEAVDERCVDETVDQPPEERVVGADLAAWLIEDQLPPPLRTAGLQSGATMILLDGEPVGQVSTVVVGEGIFIVTGYSFCAPTDLELASIDVDAILGGDWHLIGGTPDLGLPADAEVRLTITGDWAGGRVVCNEYGGLVAAGPEGAWRISELSFTEMGCTETDSDYFDRFGTTTSVSLDGSELVLEGPDGTLRYAHG